jgi:hypothetical protein
MICMTWPANISFILILLGLTTTVRAQTEVAPGVLLLGLMQNTNVNESSGLIPSHRSRNYFWTHNDGDDSIFAFTRDGRFFGKWGIPALRAQAATVLDFEDIAWSPGRIYAGDIGNNDLLRTNIFVYSVPEPGPTFSGSLPLKRTWRLSYPPDEEPFDAESLLVHRKTGYIIAKDRNNGEAPVYRFSLQTRTRKAFPLERICKIDVDDDVGGADLTPDGQRLAVITGIGAYLFALPGDFPTNGTLEPELFVPYELDLMEGCCFTPDGLLVTAETGEILLFTDERFKLPPPPRQRSR